MCDIHCIFNVYLCAIRFSSPKVSNIPFARPNSLKMRTVARHVKMFVCLKIGDSTMKSSAVGTIRFVFIDR